MKLLRVLFRRNIGRNINPAVILVMALAFAISCGGSRPAQAPSDAPPPPTLSSELRGTAPSLGEMMEVAARARYKGVYSVKWYSRTHIEGIPPGPYVVETWYIMPPRYRFDMGASESGPGITLLDVPNGSYKCTRGASIEQCEKSTIGGVGTTPYSMYQTPVHSLVYMHRSEYLAFVREENPKDAAPSGTRTIAETVGYCYAMTIIFPMEVCYSKEGLPLSIDSYEQDLLVEALYVTLDVKEDDFRVPGQP